MAVLTSTRALPGLLASLLAHLARAGALPREGLWDRFVPAPLREAGEAPKHTFDDTLALARTLGLLQERPGGLELTDAGRDAWAGRTSVEGFMAAWMLDPALAGTDPLDPEAEARPTGDLARTLAWFLELDPTDVPLYQATGAQRRHHAAVRLEEAGGDPAWAPTDAAWHTFSRWALYLGFARQRPVDGKTMGIVPDAHRVVRRALPQLTLSAAQPIAAFLGELGQRVPVLCGPAAERAQARMAAAEGREVKPCLAFALERLAREGEVLLTRQGDAEEWAFRFGRFTKVAAPDGDRRAQVRTYTHVGRAAKGAAA